MQTMSTLTADERLRYERDGYLVRESVLDAAELETLRLACEELCNRLSEMSSEDRKIDVSAFYVFEVDVARDVMIKWEPGSRGVIQGVEPVAHLHPVIAEFGAHPALVEPSRELLGFDVISLYTEKLNTKRSGVGGAYALHRDLPYWVGSSDDPERMVTVLLALDDASAENGALRVLPGSHLMDDLPFKDSELEFERNELDPERLDTSAMISVEVPAGSAIFFGPRLIHTSGSNRSSVDRRAMLYTYQRAGQRDMRDYNRDWYASQEELKNETDRR
jgi:ectoine hydroxylase-related dioxygenase (phytanoyl-CoA dioxygenase family)